MAQIRGRVVGENSVSPAARVISELKSRGLTLATCESLTGGGLGAAITAISGASVVYRGGLITYASDLKHTLASVDAAHIAEFGVINELTARQMAVGAAGNCRADIGIATTGVAGPDPQDGEMPGTVWLGLVLPAGWDERVRAKKVQLTGDRAAIREATISEALHWLLNCLKIQDS